MRWLIRSTDFRTFQEHETIIEADTRAAAETVARERRMTVTSVEPLDGDEHQTNSPRATLSLSFLGKPLHSLQLVSLMLCGLATIGVLLQSGGVLSR